MPLQYKTLFNDPSPGGFVNLRYVIHMIGIAQTYTDFSDPEFNEFVKHLLLVAKKLVATWSHMDRYIQLEDALIAAEEKNPPIETLDIQHISYSQDLFLELDEFLVQLKSTLDYLAKLPLAIIGKNNWPYLRTFGDKGGAVIKALKNNVPKKWAKQAAMIEEMVFGEQGKWIEMAVASRDRSNHFKDGGVDAEVFLVAKTTVDGKEKVVVPMWLDNLTVRDYLWHTWHNLVAFTEQFTIGFLVMRFKEGFGFAHIPKPAGSLASPIVVLPDNAIDSVLQVMHVIQKKSKLADKEDIN
ncbi:MAG: hypothetical protein QOE47_1811 [Pyrinomonadaceae bacterium]|nr:hypothetical protein [Pyrinomonadaceae bacterium]